MPSIAQLLAERSVRTTRPNEYKDLLLEPIVDAVPENALSMPTESYAGWEHDHAVARRFYVAGVNWFKRETKITQDEVIQCRDKILRVITKTNWRRMPDPDGHWRKPLGKPQIINAFNGTPMPFAKAAQVLAAFEIALGELMKALKDEEEQSANEEQSVLSKKDIRTVPPGFTSAEQIHGFMAIYPACYNIDNFGQDYLQEIRAIDPKAVANLREAAGQRDDYPIDDLANRLTGSKPMAVDILAYATANYRTTKTLGRVRGRPGKFLGKANATEHEEIDLG